MIATLLRLLLAWLIVGGLYSLLVDCDPYAGEDPDEDYLAAEAERHAAYHEERAHAGRPCDCPAAPGATGEAPF